MEKELVILFYGLMLINIICDALRDAWVFDSLYGDGELWFIDDLKWHPVKNLGRLSGWIAFYVIGGGHPVFSLIAFLVFIPGAWAVWQMVYNYARDKRLFSTYDFNLSKFIMMKGKDGRPFMWRIHREIMIIISIMAIAASAAGMSIMIDLAR